MKTLKMISIGLVFCTLTTMVVASAQQKEAKATRRASVQNTQRVNRPETGRAVMNREEAYKRMMSNRMEQHQKGINELEAIKKIAEEEEATRTVEALQTLIAQKDKAFKDSIAQFEKTRRMRAERLEQRRDQLKTRKIEDDDDDDKKELPTVTPKEK